jgi:hypothetical protein
MSQMPMPLSDRMSFVFFVLFFLAWFSINGRAAFRTSEFLASNLGRQFYKDASPRLARVLSFIFLSAGVLFVGLALWELHHGTFQWRGSDHQYGFRDLLP